MRRTTFASVVPQRLTPVLLEIQPLYERFLSAGKNIYLVGGIVRDILLDAKPLDALDFDLTTDATPEESKKILRGWCDDLWTQGERFGTIGCRKNGRVYEITTHRAEIYTDDSRKPVVTFSTEIEADLARRDFTVNAMALALDGDSFQLIDPFHGADDLVAKVLRTPLSPQISFLDDPLRMLRAARFLAGYGFVPVDELTAAAKEHASRLSIVSAERIRDEFDKLLVVPDPSDGFWFLVEIGLFEYFLPELPEMRLEQDPIHHHKDVLAHTIAVVCKTQPERIIRLAALFHDVGKPQTRNITDAGVSFHHHEVVGARMTRRRMRAMKYSNDDIAAVSQLVYLHLRFHTYQMGWSDSAVRRFVRDAGDLLPQLLELTRCDCTTRNKKKADALEKRLDELDFRIAELAKEEELRALRPDLNGREIMELLSVPPGKIVGDALAMLLEVRLDNGPIEFDTAKEILFAWWQTHPENTAVKSSE